MNVYFYTRFGKRNNSTLRPSITDTTQFTTHDCKLKQNCSEHEPVFILNSNEFGYVYAYVPSWHKFYYTVDVITLANSLTEYHMSEDFAASFKYNIGNTTSRIMYSSNDFDDLIIDPRVQVLSNKRRATKVPTVNIPVFDAPSGWYILSCLSAVNVLGVSTGFAANYLFSPSGIEKLRQWFTMTGFLTAISQYLKGEPLSSIFKVIWVPYNIDSAYLSGQSVCCIGNIYSDGPGYNITFDQGECAIIKGHPFIYKSYSIALDRRYSDYRRCEPYTTGLLHLPGIGMVDLCYGDCGGSNALSITVTIEVLTGNVKYEIEAGTFTIHVATTNVASDCPIGRDVTDGGGVMTGLASALGGAVTLVGAAATSGGAAVAAGAGAVIAGTANTVLSANKHSQTISGQIGGRIAVNAPYVYLEEFAVETEDPDDADYIALQGRPYNGVAKISDLVPSPVAPIYVQCIDGRVNPRAIDSEQNNIVTYPNLREQVEINNLLNSGLYYE